MTTQISSDSNAVHSLTTFDTDIVVDLGCCSYERNGRLEDSIHTLIKRFKPAVLFGFDPHPGLPDAVGQVYGTTVITSRRAAWLFDGVIGFDLQGNCSHVDSDALDAADCFDVAAWVRALPEANAVLKLDIEGAEYMLLPHLVEQKLMDRFSLVLVEWHEGQYANGYESDREAILAGIDCPVEEWQ